MNHAIVEPTSAPKNATIITWDKKTAPRFDADLADITAVRLLGALSPYCHKIGIAGSLRRKAPRVGDIELVAIPKLVERADLLGGPLPSANLLDQAVIHCLTDRNHLEFALRAQPDGSLHFGTSSKRLMAQGIPVDLFSVLPPREWGPTFVLRTGPADFNKRLVIPRTNGGWRPPEIYWQDAVIHRANGETIPTPAETDVFAALDLPYIRPRHRTNTVHVKLRHYKDPTDQATAVYGWMDKGRWIDAT